jgi:glycosyltransferase involved in cell wall biosynthesis
MEAHMKFNPLISIILPCYNYGKFLPEAFKSLFSQTYSNWECIVVNDGSTDNSKEVIDSFAREDERIKVIEISNSGVSVARNTAILNSRGSLLFPLDADNKLFPECLERCLKEFQRNPDVKLVYSETELFGDASGLWNLPSFDYRTMLEYNMIDNSCLFLREDFDRVGGYRLNMINGLEDWDFFIALLEPYSKEQIIKIAEPLYYYRVTDSSRRSTLNKSDKFNLMRDNIVLNNFSIYQKYFPNIFRRIHAYNYQHVMMNKPLVKLVVRFYGMLSKIKQRLK